MISNCASPKAPVPSSLTTVSVVIRTRNRADKLARLLDALARQDLPSNVRFECIVADNGSTDHTADSCAIRKDSFNGGLKYLNIKIPNRSRTGNAGMRTASGEIVAFLDDDVVPSPDYLSVIAREFSDPNIDGISGRVLLYDPQALPMAIRTIDVRRQFTTIDDAFSLFIGCNFVVRRWILDEIGLYDFAIDASEDADFFYRAWKAGAKLVYVPELSVEHDHGRAVGDLGIERQYITGRAAFYLKHIIKRDRTVAAQAYWELRKLALRCLRGPERENAFRYLRWFAIGAGSYVKMRAKYGPFRPHED